MGLITTLSWFFILSLLVMKIFLAFICFCFFECSEVLAAQSDLQTVANSKDWLALVHYQSTMFGGVEGTIDSESFYLADDGRNNPESELLASISLFEKTVKSVMTKNRMMR